jgi:hypothetical protein
VHFSALLDAHLALDSGPESKRNPTKSTRMCLKETFSGSTKLQKWSPQALKRN